ATFPAAPRATLFPYTTLFRSGQGRAAVQDEASQLAVLALTRVDVSTPDRRWLDLCAGPGGKARLLAGLAASSGARLLAADARWQDRKSTRLNSSHEWISYAVF